MAEEALHEHMCETCPADSRQPAICFCRCERDGEGNRCPNYGKYFCEECVTEELHNHMPEWITVIVDNIKIRWEALYGTGTELKNKMEKCLGGHKALLKYLEGVIERHNVTGCRNLTEAAQQLSDLMKDFSEIYEAVISLS